MKQLFDALDSATDLTARKLTAGLRRTAIRSGWDSEVVRNLSVAYSDGRFDVSIPEQYKEKAMDFEYGNQERRPTAVIRKLKHSNRDSSEFLSIWDRLGKK
jgi:hypothetical protein